jgi:tetratricopeptide (TPR) repeat protein
MARGKRFQEAEESLRKAVDICATLPAHFLREPFYRGNTIFFRDSLVSFLKDAGRQQQAEEVCREGIEFYAKLAAANATEPGFRIALAESYLSLVALLKDSGQTHDAEKAARKALHLVEKLAAESPPTPPNQESLANCHFQIGFLLAQLGRTREALQGYRRCIELSPTNAVAYNNLAWLLATCPDSKFREPRQAVEAAKKALELRPNEGNHWNTLGVARYRAGDCKAAIAALERSMQLRKGGDSSDWFFLAMAHWQLGDKDQARKWYDQAVRWTEKNRPNDEELRRFRTEAAGLLGVSEKKD